MASLSAPAAIVVGFGLLSTATGLGLYFGLRGNAASSPVDSAPAVATLTGATSRAGGVAAVFPTASAAAAGVTIDAAKAAIAAQHAHLVDKCWNPSLAHTPAQVTLTVVLDYAEDGRLATSSLKPDVPTARPDVTICVNKELVLPVVSAPGRRVAVRVPITLP